MNPSTRFLVYVTLLGGWLLVSGSAAAFTVYSTTESFMGAGTFYGPGRLPDSVLFDVRIRNVAFTTAATFVTPFFNNGAQEPNVEGEIATSSSPDGFFSADVGPFELNGIPFLVGIGAGGAHQGEQISVLLDGHTMIMTMDIVFNGDGYIDGTLVAVGVMPLSSPIYPGQPYALSRNFETDIHIDGVVHGSAKDVNKAYGFLSDEGVT